MKKVRVTIFERKDNKREIIVDLMFKTWNDAIAFVERTEHRLSLSIFSNRCLWYSIDTILEK